MISSDKRYKFNLDKEKSTVFFNGLLVSSVCQSINLKWKQAADSGGKAEIWDHIRNLCKRGLFGLTLWAAHEESLRSRLCLICFYIPNAWHIMHAEWMSQGMNDWFSGFSMQRRLLGYATVEGARASHLAILDAFTREKITFEDFLCSCLSTLVCVLSFNTMSLWNLYCRAHFTTRKRV